MTKKLPNNKYVREGFILLHSARSVEWSAKQTKKRGRPYIYSDNFVTFASHLRYNFHLGFRQLEGFLLAIQEYYHFPKIPDFSTLWRRIVQKAQVVKTFTNKEYDTLIVDGSGMSKVSRCAYLGQKWRKNRPFLKIHFGVNEFGDLVFFEVTKNKGSSEPKIALQGLKALPKLPKKFSGDGSYDYEELFKFCHKHKIEPIIPVRKNAKRKPLANPLRAKEIDWQKDIERWKEEKNYKIRTTVERSFSAFKRRFGSAARALKYEEQSIFRMIECFVMLQNIQ